MSAGEATINPDGSTTFASAAAEEDPTPNPPPFEEEEDAGSGGGGYDMPPEDADEMFEDVVKGIDPAFYFIGAVLLCALAYYFLVYRRKSEDDEDTFFSNLDGEKFNLKLPKEVDEYYAIKEKCEAAGWEPGKPAADAAAAANPNAPTRAMAQALMKRAMADIPIVSHIQKESSGMNKLYAQSMCSVSQWRAYQNAEALVSAEVQEVRAEADEIEPGWSQLIWRQAMQYHNMLKQKHEAEQKAAEEQARKRKEIEAKVKAARAAQEENKLETKESAAEKAAEELIKAEEREQASKAAFKAGSTSMKKGFLDSSKGKKK